MARIAVQAGHVYRRSGSTGTVNEQPVVEAIARMVTDTTRHARLPLAERLIQQAFAQVAAVTLRDHGHRVTFLTADQYNPPSADVFVSLHCDGSYSPRASGASVGYPDGAGGRIAREWKRAYARRGWPYGFRPDNYTPGLRHFYYYRRINATRRFVIEHGFNTNSSNYRWLTSTGGLRAAALALVDAVGVIYGHPKQPSDPEGEPQEDTMDITNGQPARIAQRLVNAAHAHPRFGGFTSSKTSFPLEVDGMVGPNTRAGVDAMRGAYNIGRDNKETDVLYPEDWLTLEMYGVTLHDHAA